MAWTQKLAAAAARGGGVVSRAAGLLHRDRAVDQTGPHARARRTPRSVTVTFSVLGAVLVVIIVAAALLAAGNLRRQRGDRRGALRLAAFVFCVQMALWASRAHIMRFVRHVRHVSGGAGDLHLLRRGDVDRVHGARAVCAPALAADADLLVGGADRARPRRGGRTRRADRLRGGRGAGALNRALRDLAAPRGRLADLDTTSRSRAPADTWPLVSGRSSRDSRGSVLLLSVSFFCARCCGINGPRPAAFRATLRGNELSRMRAHPWFNTSVAFVILFGLALLVLRWGLLAAAPR